MRREGRQHGMVRSYRIMPSPFNPRPQPRFINRFESPPTAGLFTKVSTKPTNHSKFTGKCARPKCSDCHIHPACKSKDKTKGTQKLRSSSDCGLLSWRVVDGVKSPGLKKVSGSSAIGILDNLGSDKYSTPYLDDYHDDDYDYDYEGDSTEVFYDYDYDYGNEGDSTEVFDDFNESEIESAGAVDVENDDDDDDKMSLCDLGIVWEEVYDGDEDWRLVGNNVIV